MTLIILATCIDGIDRRILVGVIVKFYCRVEIIKSDISFNITIKHSVNLMTYRNSKNNSDSDGDGENRNDIDSNSNSYSDSNSDHNSNNESNGTKKSHFQDEPGILVNSKYAFALSLRLGAVIFMSRVMGTN